MTTRLQQLYALGQSPWYDSIRRRSITSGELQALIDRGIRGVTVNPTIFEKAIASGDDYDAAIRAPALADAAPSEVYESLLIEDITAAADLFRPIYEQSNGGDGFVSIEVSPLLAHDTAASIAEARRFWQRIDRPNVMVKIPATAEGMPAIQQLTAEGINVNVTLIFGLTAYDQVIAANLAGLERRAAAGHPLDRVASVASFFVSRVDSEVDKRLDALVAAEADTGRRAELAALRGMAAVANARLAYQRFLTAFGSERFSALRARGARVQRPLWASTGTKNPAYSDVKYVDELIGADTITTLPLATIEAFQDHGHVARTIDVHVAEAQQIMDGLEAAGIGMHDVADRLLAAGIAAFVDSLAELQTAILRKRESLLASA